MMREASWNLCARRERRCGGIVLLRAHCADVVAKWEGFFERENTEVTMKNSDEIALADSPLSSFPHVQTP